MKTAQRQSFSSLPCPSNDKENPVHKCSCGLHGSTSEKLLLSSNPTPPLPSPQLFPLFHCINHTLITDLVTTCFKFQSLLPSEHGSPLLFLQLVVAVLWVLSVVRTAGQWLLVWVLWKRCYLWLAQAWILGRGDWKWLFVVVLPIGGVWRLAKGWWCPDADKLFDAGSLPRRRSQVWLKLGFLCTWFFGLVGTVCFACGFSDLVVSLWSCSWCSEFRGCG